MKSKLLLNIFSAILTVVMTVMTVYYVLTPVNALFLFLTPIYYNFMRMIFVFRVGWLAGISAEKFSFFRKILTRKVFKAVNFVSIVLYVIFAVNMIEGCVSFDFSMDNSLLNSSYEVSESSAEVLPYHGYFVQEGGKSAYYDVNAAKMKKSSFLSVSNRKLELKVDSPSYQADYFRSNIDILRFKFRLEQNFGGIVFSFFRNNEADKHYSVTEDGIKKEYMSVDNSYYAVYRGKDYMCCIKLLNIYGTSITFLDFVTEADKQLSIIDSRARDNTLVS